MKLSTQEIIQKYNIDTHTLYRTDKKVFIPFCRRNYDLTLTFLEKIGRTNYYEVIENTLENEIWIKCNDLPDCEVSSMGRIKRNGKLLSGTINNGYVQISGTGKDKNIHYRIHRLILNSFFPMPNAKDLVVDHINGIKTDNRLENLRWLSAEENTKLSFENRKPFDKELTRLIEKYGYNKALEIISLIE